MDHFGRFAKGGTGFPFLSGGPPSTEYEHREGVEVHGVVEAGLAGFFGEIFRERLLRGYPCQEGTGMAKLTIRVN